MANVLYCASLWFRGICKILISTELESYEFNGLIIIKNIPIQQIPWSNFIVLYIEHAVEVYPRNKGYH